MNIYRFYCPCSRTNIDLSSARSVTWTFKSSTWFLSSSKTTSTIWTRCTELSSLRSWDSCSPIRLSPSTTSGLLLLLSLSNDYLTPLIRLVSARKVFTNGSCLTNVCFSYRTFVQTVLPTHLFELSYLDFDWSCRTEVIATIDFESYSSQSESKTRSLALLKRF